jgi:hypothetical protein
VSFLVIKVWQVYINILFCKRASNGNGQGQDHSMTLRSGMADSTIKLFLINHVLQTFFGGHYYVCVYYDHGMQTFFSLSFPLFLGCENFI